MPPTQLGTGELFASAQSMKLCKWCTFQSMIPQPPYFLSLAMQGCKDASIDAWMMDAYSCIHAWMHECMHA